MENHHAINGKIHELSMGHGFQFAMSAWGCQVTAAGGIVGGDCLARPMLQGSK